MASTTPLSMPPREELVHRYQDEKLSFKKLSEIYGVSMGTMSKWFRVYEISTGRTRTVRVRLKEISGVAHRQCFGPLHNGEWVPASKFPRHGGKPYGIGPRCRRCKTPNGRINFTSSYQAWVTSIYRRIGYMETCRRLKISEKTLTKWQTNPPQTIRRENAESIVCVLSELRKTGEVRHRKSIRRGASLRGEQERPVSRITDLLHRTQGDAATEEKRAYRKRQRELDLTD